MKKVLIIIIVFISIALIGTGVYLSTTPAPKEENKQEEKEPEKEKVEYRKQEGCSVVEMECSALAACAQFRSVVFGQILYTADTLCNLEKWDARNWGKNSIECALKLCLDSVLKL